MLELRPQVTAYPVAKVNTICISTGGGEPEPYTLRGITLSVFYVWLTDQCGREDETGRLAREVLKDKTFPRSMRKLHLFLHYYRREPHNYEAVKIAHREWRQFNRKMGRAA